MEQPETVGRYQVERLIAHGGMGSLYLARDPVIDRPIVIKFLKVGFDDSAARERFAREARAAGRLHHPNIVTVFDVGEHEDRPFIAMEYVAGETLAQLIARRGVRRLWEKLLIIEELCAGLHYAHAAAIIHRDIKPSNVMRDQSGVVKILDFGIARGAGGAVTEAGDIVGTLNYMSPEQLAGEDVDHRTDIYSVGVLAYELITDQMAFPGTIQTGVLFKILNSAALPIESLIPGIDPDIPAVIARAIARDPEARYTNLEALRQDLAVVRTRLLEAAGDDEFEDAADPEAETRILLPRPSSGLLTPPSARSGSALGSARRTAPVPDAPPRRRRTAGVLVAVAGTLALALAGSWVFGWLPLTSPQSSSISEGSGPAPQPSASGSAPTTSASVPAPKTSASAAATEPASSVPPPSAAPVSAKAKAPASPSSKEEQVTGRGQRSPAAPPAAPPSASPTSGNPPVPASPSPEALNTLPGRANKPPGPPQPPPAAPKPEAPAQGRDTPQDPRAVDLAAVRDTLRRYVEAYQSLDSNAVARMMPSLSAGQIRDLERDFANYRRYTVQIKDERINIEGESATVACEVARSFETKNGVAGSHTARSTFHLRRSGAGWSITRLELR